MINKNINNKQEEYISLLTYDRGELLLEGKNLAEFANMHPDSVSTFTKLIKFALLSKYNDAYQVIKTQTYDLGSCYTSFELKVKPSIYEELRKNIFKFAYICCSNVVEEVSNNYWGARNCDINSALYQSERLSNCAQNFHAILPSTSRYKKYSVKYSFVKANEEDIQEQYNQFLSSTLTKPKKKTLKPGNNN